MNIAEASIPTPALPGEPAQPDTGGEGGAFAALIALLFGPPAKAETPEQKPAETASPAITPLPIPLPLVRQPIATEPAPEAAPPAPTVAPVQPVVAVAPALTETVIEIAAPESTPDIAPDLSQPRAAPSPQATAAVHTATPAQPHALPQAPAEAVVVRPERLAADVGIEIVRQIGAGRSEFSIRLDPPDLGRVDVRLEFNRGEVRAVVTSDNPATHDLLRRDADSFARMFADNGFRADSGAFRFDLRQETGQNQQAGTLADPVTAEAALQPEAEPARAHRGLLDLVA